jgi:hypothetical protein
METAVNLMESLASIFEGAIVRKSESRVGPPGMIEMQVIKNRALKFAEEQARLLKDPATDPDDVENSINVRVAVADVENELTLEQRDELSDLIMLKSGLHAVRAERMLRLQRKVR